MEGGVLLSEFRLIFFGERLASWRKIAERPEGEEEAARRPAQYCVAYPFDDFAKIVRARHIFVHTLCGNIVLGVSGLAKVADDVVALHIDEHSKKEYYNADNKARTHEPGKRVEAFRSKVEEPLSDEPGVCGIEYHAQKHHQDRHRTLAPHKKRKYERALEIVQQEKPSYDVEHQVVIDRIYAGRSIMGRIIEQKEESRSFHKDPPELIAHRRAPFGRRQVAISRLEKE